MPNTHSDQEEQGPHAVSEFVGVLGMLDQCDDVVLRLHKMCCEPDRSPQMSAIQETLLDVRELLSSDIDDRGLGQVLDRLEIVGGRLGKLQVGCCAPPRLPLYADVLANLNDIQLTINRVRGKGH